MTGTPDEQQRRVCLAHGAAFDPPAPGSRVGIALQTMGLVPIQGVRVPVSGDACGWYIHAGEAWSDDSGFYQPVCIEHLAERCPAAMPFLGLPAGWRFLTDGQGYEDVWFDESLTQEG